MTTTYTHTEWLAEALKRFGSDKRQWKFVCPSCGYIAKVQDWQDAKAPEGAIAFSCVGRYLGTKKEMGDKTGGPCNYTTGGLFNISPVKVTNIDTDNASFSVFDFAPAENAS